MPAIVKARQVRTSSRRVAMPLSTNQRIDAFARVSKASVNGQVKTGLTKIAAIETITPVESKPASLPAGKKRKRVEAEEEKEPKTEGDAFSTILAAALEDRPSQKRRVEGKQEQPLSTRRFTPQTPTSGSKALPTPPSTPSGLPSELHDLIELHSSFLSTLSLHYTHNGTSSPADLRVLCPSVSRKWGKRSVTQRDIQRLLGLHNSKASETRGLSKLGLSDYEHGKICVEIEIQATDFGGLRRPINEEAMNTAFEKMLTAMWCDVNADELSAARFIDSLPLEPVPLCPSAIKASSLLAKGQRRLEDLKAGMVIKKAADKAKLASTTTAHPSQDGKIPTLLERLRAKQLQKASQPPPPTKAEQARQAALERIEEVAGVLGILSTSSSIGQQRISFTFPTVMGKLQDSFKVPISRVEGEECVRLLASEIAPEWVRIVKIGKMNALVVNRDQRPKEEAIRQRVQQAN